QRRWRDHEPVPAPAREQSSKRSDERTIGEPKPRTPIVASQHQELVAQQHQLHVLGELGPSTPNEQPQNSNEGKVGEGEEHRPILPGAANARTAHSSCSGQRFLVFARARETTDGDVAPSPSRDRDTQSRTRPSRTHPPRTQSAARYRRTPARASKPGFDTLQGRPMLISFDYLAFSALLRLL